MLLMLEPALARCFFLTAVHGALCLTGQVPNCSSELLRAGMCLAVNKLKLFDGVRCEQLQCKFATLLLLHRWPDCLKKNALDSLVLLLCLYCFICEQHVCQGTSVWPADASGACNKSLTSP